MNSWIWTLMATVGAVGMALCLYGMYGDKKKGFPALIAIDGSFSSLDMRKGYTPLAVFDCLEGVGPEGQKLLKRLWKLDFLFIFFFLLVMIVIPRNLGATLWLAYGMYAAAGLRALADMVENLFLLRVCTLYPERRDSSSAKTANLATRFKWVMMALWVLLLFVCLFLRVISL